MSEHRIDVVADGQIKVAPDGICLDAEGAVWVADAFGNRAIRVREGGQIVDEVSTGELGTYACMLGGDDGRTLFCARRRPSTRRRSPPTTRAGSSPAGSTCPTPAAPSDPDVSGGDRLGS